MVTTSEVFTDAAAVDRHRDDWTRLFDASGAELSTSFEWVRAMCDTHLKRGEAFNLVVLRRDRQVIGLVPLVTTREPVAGVSFATLAPLMERYRTHSDLLIHPRDDGSIAALVGALRGLTPRWDIFRMVQVLDANPLLELLERHFAEAGARVQRRTEAPSFYLPLPPTFDAYLAARSSKFRNHLRRCEKKLAASGALTTVTAGIDVDLDAAFDDLLAIERASWKHAHGTAISAVPHQAAYYRAMAEAMHGAGRLHLTVTRLDGAPIAYNLGVVSRRQYAYLKTSYVESLKALGPATVARADLVARLIAEGIETLDFPAEPYAWEAQWTTEHRSHQSLVAYNRTLRARAYAFARRLREARHPAPAAEGIAYANARDLHAPSDGG
jgi:CelD/BcsL family acetyltransferase involved in cellulose biosynthesis